jgi:hypothetical protein
MESFPHAASGLSNIIHPTTVKEAFRYSSKLRYEDRRELMATGIHPMVALPLSVGLTADPIKFVNYDGTIAGFAGVVDEGAGVGRVWMLCTEAVEQMPMRLVKGAKLWLDSLPFQMLHNHADPRNKMHLKLLHILGFKRLSYLPVGPKQLTFVEFAKLCANR